MKMHLALVAAMGLPVVMPVFAAVPEAEAARLGYTLTPLGAERAGNADGSIPEWRGGLAVDRPAAGFERRPERFPLSGQQARFVITAQNLHEHETRLTPGHLALLRKFPRTYRMPVFPTERTAIAPDFVYEATRRNAVRAELANGGESLVNAIIGTPFPIPRTGKEIMWNHKTRYRGTSVRRYNTQIAVQADGSFQPYKLREDVRFQYSFPGQTPQALDNVIIYFMQVTTSPPRQAGNILLVHETMDQVKEARRAWVYSAGQRRVRRAPNVAYDNPGTGSDGLRTNDQLDGFNGATDRYTWKIAGKRELYLPYNVLKLADDRLAYRDLVRPGHLNQAFTRYELRRAWVVESELRPGTSHIYQRRTFYIDEDTWTILAVDIYDRRGQLWRVQEAHTINNGWLRTVAPVCGTVYDLHANRYLLMDLSNEEPLFETRDFPISYFTTSNMAKISSK